MNGPKINLCIGLLAVGGLGLAQEASSQAFQAGGPRGTTNEAGQSVAITENVRVFGSFRFAESCTFDPARNLIMALL